MTTYLVTMPDGETGRWDDESIEMARKNHLAILADPNASPEARERARVMLEALAQAWPIEDSSIASGA